MTEKVTELLENASECDVSGVFENSILKKIPTEQCISTGITLLNLNLSGNKDGGFRKGSLVQLLAETGVGKTLFGSYVMKTAIENSAFKNYKMRFIDKEGGFNIEYPKEIQDRIETYNSTNCPSLSTIERTLIMICNWLDEGVPMIICLDSTNAFISQNMLENLKANSKVVSKDTEDKQGELKEDMMGGAFGNQTELINGGETAIRFEESNFTDEEIKQIEEFANKIDLRNSEQIMQYGVSAQKKSTNFSDAALKSVKTKEFGEVGDLLTQLTTEVRKVGDEEKHGIAGWFQKRENKIEAVRARYATTEGNIRKISDALETHQFTLLKDMSMLDKLYDQNKLYFKELSMYIAAGRKKLDEVRSGELAELQQRAQTSMANEDIQEARDLANMCDRFEKKLHDLELTRTITLQTAPQIRLVQEDDALMAEKIQSTINNTIPLWKNQMVLALGVAHADEAAKAQKLVSDITNDMLKKNAEKLKMATITAAEEKESSIVDMETLQYTNEQLITTIDEVLRIQSEGQSRRREAETELVKIENELKAKLIEASTGGNDQ